MVSVSTSRSTRTTSARLSGRVSGVGSGITPRAIRCSTYGMVQCCRGTYGEASCAMARWLRAELARRPVATSNAAWSRAREGARMERAIWGRVARLGRPTPGLPRVNPRLGPARNRALPLQRQCRVAASAANSLGRSPRTWFPFIKFPAHASPPGAHRGRAGHDVRGSDRAIRDGAGGGDCVLATGARSASDRQPGGAGREQGAGSGEQDLAPHPAPYSPLPAPFDDVVGATPGAPFLVLDRVAPVHDGRELGGAGVAQADRKSTRLNSSHLVISYAVFCLKKK